MPTFTPPTVDGYAIADRRQPDPSHQLWSHYGSWAMGQTVWKDGSGTWHQGTFPYQGGVTSTVHNGTTTTTTGPDTGLATAEVVYAGGHVHVITDAEATALEAAGFGAYINTADVELHWSAGEETQFGDHYVLSQDGAHEFGLSVESSTGTFRAVAGAEATSSNHREVFVSDRTTGWSDVEMSTLFVPPAFTASPQINPQHGIACRVTNDGAGNTSGVMFFHDVAFGSPTIIHIAVFKADSTNITVRTESLNPSGLGPLATNVFPYRVDATVEGTTARVRVYPPDEGAPDWDHPTLANEADLDSFGDTVSIPTPSSGAAGFFVGHVGNDSRSAARFGPTTFRRLD